MSNKQDVLDLMNDPDVVININGIGNEHDIITFYTADSVNEILRSVLEHLLTSVN